jgi:hypothetical protein
MRIEPRQAIMYRVAVAWDDETGTPRSQDGMLEDRSSSGAGIFITRAIPAGTRVKIRQRGEERSGVVRHCRPDNTGYFMGVQFDDRSACSA